MKYVLQESVKRRKRYYVYSDSLIHYKLGTAKVFDTLSEIESFREQQFWVLTYKTIAVTEKDLFKAKLANQ